MANGPRFAPPTAGIQVPPTQNPFAALLGSPAPQVNVPDPITQSPLQAGLMGLLSFFNPQFAGQLQQGQQQRTLQRQGAIQRAQATNVGLRAQREGQVAQLKQRQRQFKIRSAAENADRDLRRATEDRLMRMADANIALINARIDELERGQDQFTRGQVGTSAIAFGGFEKELGVLTGEVRGASGAGGRLLADDMMTAWRQAGGDNNPSAALDAAMNVFDQAVQEAQSLSASIGLLPDDAIKAGDLMEAKFKRQMDAFNSRLTSASEKLSKRRSPGAVRRRKQRSGGIPRFIP